MKSIFCLLVLISATHLHAQEFYVQPFAASDNVTNTTNYEPGIQAIDGEGLNVLGTPTDIETGDLVPALPMPAHEAGRVGRNTWRYREDLNPSVVLTFDLAGDSTAYDLSGMRVWNYNETGSTGRGVEGVTIEWSNDGGTSWFDAGLGNTSTPTAGLYEFSEASGVGTYDGERIDFGSTLSGATNVRFSSISNFGTAGSIVGLSEIRFIAIPEPSTIALVALSFVALIGFRRRGK